MSAVRALLLAIPMSIKTKEREREQEIDEADGGILFLALGDDMPQAPSIGIRLNHWLLNQEKEKSDKPKNAWQVLTVIQVCNANALR